MPRKSLPRAFKLVCKHYKGFDRHFATKAIATRKLHASQGIFVNHKLASTPDCKYGRTTGRPLVRSYSTSYPSFAAQPVAAHSRHVGKLPGYQQALAAQLQPAAPSFAAAPVWSGRDSDQPSLSSRSDADPSVQAASPSASQLSVDPLYQYATLDQRPSPGKETSSRRASSRRHEHSALKWFGSLDRRPISKVSGRLATPPSSRQSDRSRLAAAFAKYADLDGPKH